MGSSAGLAPSGPEAHPGPLPSWNSGLLPQQQRPPAGPAPSKFSPSPKNMMFSGGARASGQGEQAVRLSFVGVGHGGPPASPQCCSEPAPVHQRGRMPSLHGCHLATCIPAARSSSHTGGGGLRRRQEKQKIKYKEEAPASCLPSLAPLCRYQQPTFPGNHQSTQPVARRLPSGHHGQQDISKADGREHPVPMGSPSRKQAAEQSSMPRDTRSAGQRPSPRLFCYPVTQRRRERKVMSD